MKFMDTHTCILPNKKTLSSQCSQHKFQILQDFYRKELSSQHEGVSGFEEEEAEGRDAGEIFECVECIFLQS